MDVHEEFEESEESKETTNKEIHHNKATDDSDSDNVEVRKNLPSKSKISQFSIPYDSVGCHWY